MPLGFGRQFFYKKGNNANNVHKEFTNKVLTNRADGCIVLNVVSTQTKRVLMVLKRKRKGR